MPPPVFEVDFRSPEALLPALDQYLTMGVCPVSDVPFPGAMVDVSLRLMLPGETTVSVDGRVIQQMGPSLFLVQLAGRLDLLHLKALATSAPADQPLEDEAPTGYESDHSAVYATVPSLPVEEKRRLARNGNKVMRQLLIKDPNKSLHVMVVQNPRVTLDEALEYSKRPNVSGDALKTLAQNRTFLNSQQFIFNLVRNPSTPTDIATRLLSRLSPNQLRIIAKSNSVRMPISAGARKLVLQKLGK